MPTVTRAGISLFYSEEGAGPPVILHTGGAGDGDMFRPSGYVSALAAAGYRALAYDHRGHGRSGKPATVLEHGLEEYVDDVVALLDALAVESAAIVGYSKGMHVALGVAAAYRARVAAIVGIGAVGAAGEPDDWRHEGAAFARAHGTAASMQEFAEAEAEPPPAWLLDNLSSTDAEQFALQLEADGPDLWELLPRIEAPTLLVCGELEEDRAAVNVRAAADVLPDGEAFVVPGLAHLAIFWRTDLTLAAITRFLAERYPRS
jgi:pimeloyl-ACP methyl ester carboxylesterase